MLALLFFRGGSPAAAVVVPAAKSEGGQRHEPRRKSFRYDRWGRKKREAYKKSPEAVAIVEQVAQEYVQDPQIAAATARLNYELKQEQIKAVYVYTELLRLEIARLEYERDEADDDDEFLLLQ